MNSAAVVHTIRPATVHDAPELVRLLTALGHPTAAEAIVSRWEGWAGAGNSALVALADNDTPAGVVSLHRMAVLHRPLPVGRITALVVDPQRRAGASAGHWLSPRKKRWH